eukprot:m.4852 g.4852  ORF g.4852 m.4852 type:complete len:113 (+) comp11414_c0_seq2:736-1074(+)
MAKPYTMNVTTAAMRWIDKAGGFDPYILHTPDKKLASDFGSKLKKEMQEKIQELELVGVPPRVQRMPKKPAWWSEAEEKAQIEIQGKLPQLPKRGKKLPPPGDEYAAKTNVE